MIARYMPAPEPGAERPRGDVGRALEVLHAMWAPPTVAPTVASLVARTRLPRERVVRALDQLQAWGLVEERHGRWYEPGSAP